MKLDLKVLDPRLRGWGFPSWGSPSAAGLDLHACIDVPILIQPQAPAILISAGIAFRIGDPEWCAFVLPRSGLGHKRGLVLGNTVGLIDADYEGTCLISAWNRNPERGGEAIEIRPGDRIAQLVFVRITRPEFAIVVSSFSGHGARQDGGFGSTGVEPACPDPGAG
ncbi:MAG: dUTP diphosphatase [Stellaceae bacterium]